MELTVNPHGEDLYFEFLLLFLSHLYQQNNLQALNFLSYRSLLVSLYIISYPEGHFVAHLVILSA